MLTISHPNLTPALNRYYALTAGQLQGQERQRKDIMGNLTLYFGLASLILACLAVWSYSNFGLEWPTRCILFFGIALIIGYYKKATRALRGKAKSTIMTGLADTLNWSYEPIVADFADLNLFQDNLLVPRRHDYIHFEDKIRGKLRTNDFIATECHMEKRSQQNGGKQRRRTLFRGCLIEIDFHRKFQGRTLVLRDKGIFNSKNKSGLACIGLVDPVFEKAFEAYGTDQVEARYLLTPTFMQKLVDLERSVDGKNIRFAFTGGKLLIAVETPNRYEVGNMFTPLTDARRIQRFFDEFAALYHIIDSIADNPRLTAA